MNDTVKEGIRELKKAFPASTVEVEADEEGGAFIKVHDLLLGHQYEPSRSWVAFRISFQYPFADVYPHFLPAEVQRVDRVDLTNPFHKNHPWVHGTVCEPAIMVSRRSNKREPAADFAAIKLAKVLDWIQAQ